MLCSTWTGRGLDWTDCSSVCPACLPSHRSAITTTLPSSRARAAHYPSIQSSRYPTRVLPRHTTALHSATTTTLSLPVNPSFPDPTIVHYPPPSPRLDTSLLPSLSLSIFLHTRIWNQSTGRPSIRHDCFASRLIFVVHIISHPSSLLESGA